MRQWDWNQTYTASDYLKLMLSYSATQMMDEPDRLGLLADMDAFIQAEFGGHVTRPLVVTLTTAFSDSTLIRESVAQDQQRI